jgi:alpha-glucoside transport system permease protein|tara:strand:- start:325 stop:483 length:159 start_codon:yes stop_codon:yes gene_type:complete
MTTKLRQLMGTYGGDYQILTASAFVTIIVPLLVFLGLQKYFVKGLVAGSVKE